MVKFFGPLTAGWAVVREHGRAYVVLNILYYALMLAAMTAAAIRPSLQNDMLRDVDQKLTSGPLSSVGSAYSGGMVLRATALTFAINLVVGSVAWITLPSLLIPFGGVLMGLYRAILWGLIFSPANPEMRALDRIPHVLTIILEGQGYIVAMLAAWIQGRNLIAPGACGISWIPGRLYRGPPADGEAIPIGRLEPFGGGVL